MKKIIFSLMACAALCACSSDDIISDATSTASQDDVYMKFNIKMSDATRTATGETTTEEGTADENAVKDVFVVLAQSGTPLATGSYVPSVSTSSEYVAKFTSEEVASLAGQIVDVYIYCNSDVTESTFNVNGTCDIEASETTSGVTITTEPWTAGKFMMSNAEPASAELPVDLSQYNSDANAFDLGVVDVERSAARFDYKASNDGNAYTVIDGAGVSYTITITEVALINLNTGFNYLRHTADDNGSVAANLSEITLLGEETANNWVTDWDSAFKNEYNGGSLTSNYTYRSTSPTIWPWQTIPSSTSDYTNIAYATENTLPSAASYKQGLATCMVFKASIVPVEGTFTSEDRIYVYDGIMYDGWSAVATATEENQSLKAAYDYVMSVAEAEGLTGSNWNEHNVTISAAMKEVGFTGYSKDSSGVYYAYYYYWNEHNVDADTTPGLGIMEYGVVRNNVYKLAVTDITGFGHPTPPIGSDDPNYDPDGDDDPSDNGDPHDPDPDDPTDPDSPIVDQTVHFQVEVNILPWTLRENNIEF